MIYGYRCDDCDVEWERVCSLAEYEETPEYYCPRCHGETRQRLYRVAGILHASEFQAFRSPVDGTVIQSRRDLAEHNKRNNVMNLHDGYDEKAVQTMTHKDYQAPLDKERGKDLKTDIEKAIAQCTDGYKPQVAREDEPL